MARHTVSTSSMEGTIVTEKGHMDKGSQLKKDLPSVIPDKIVSTDEPPDGGYGWVVVACVMAQNTVSWGMNSCFSIFLSYYLENDYFPGATQTQYAFVGGLGIGLGLFVAPLANLLSKKYDFRVPMAIGALCLCLGQVFAGLSHHIWELFLTQGALFGIGLGFTFIPSLPIVSQWFNKKRALANGMAGCGSGIGGIIYSITTRIAIDNIGLKWAFITNGLITLVVMIPVLVFIRGRVKVLDAKFEPLQLSLLVHRGFFWVWNWAFFATLGYIIALYSMATYATQGLGLSQSQGATVQSVCAAGQVVGRPLCGILLDRFGRINMTLCLTFFAGLTILVIWMFSTSYAVLLVFAFLQGATGGILWTGSGVVTAEVVGLQHLASALAILWLVMTPPSISTEAIALALRTHSVDDLGLSGIHAFRSCIGFAGGCFVFAAIMLFGAKRYVQKDFTIFKKT